MMSCRPLPVTATVTKPKWMEPKVLAGRERTFSLESSGSTSSLVSILDHDSYDSYESDYNETQAEKMDQNINLSKEPIRERNLEATDDYSSILSENVNNNNNNNSSSRFLSEEISKIETSMESLTTEDDNLSSWESWLIRKTKLQRQIQKQMVEKKQQEKQMKEEEANEKLLTSIKAAEKRKIWLEKKAYEEKLRKRMDRQRKRVEEDIKREEKERIEEKSERKFKEWLEKKNMLEKQRKKEEILKKKAEEELKREKEEKAKEKYENWCKLAQKRPKSVPNSFGYTSGKLTGYHDRSAYPVPSFYNPVPWQPNHVSKSGSNPNQRRLRPKYQWNPDKYR